MDFVNYCGAVEVSVSDLVPWKLLRIPGGYVIEVCT